MRTDRSGAVIHDMLFAHAYAYYNGLVYEGTCISSQTRVHQYRQARNIVMMLNLSSQLKFNKGCTNKYILKPTHYRKDTFFMTAAWVSFMRAFVPFKKVRKHTISVHVRRGDVNENTALAGGFSRYKPNVYFINRINRVKTSNSVVSIFTEQSESLTEFRSQNYSICLDSHIPTIWKTWITSEHFIMSPSSFSYVPAIFALGTVMYSPFWHGPLPFWNVVH